MAAEYVGRFAPSPSGPLHAGSLLAALASFLDARANNGRWLVRIEDIDPPREQAGADRLILQTLTAHGLLWDDVVVYQSTRHSRYNAILDQLAQAQQIYHCNCTRQRLQSLNYRYDRHCLTEPPAVDAPAALRFRAPDVTVVFDDRIVGTQAQDLTREGDGVIHRKDGLYAYMLAVVVDDIDQGITDIVRGEDILPVTGRQIALYQALNAVPPRYAHIPLALGADGRKLSKQNGAPALDNTTPAANLFQALSALKQNPPPELANVSVQEILDWAVANWRIEQLRPSASN